VSSANFDVIVAGAGLVGACTALALAGKGFRVAIIEAVTPCGSADSSTSDYDLRVSAISPRSRGILQQLGVWQQLADERVCYYEQMHIWHQHGQASVAFDAVDLARDNLGAIVENRLLQQALYHACERESRIEWFMPDHIDTLLQNNIAGIELRLDSGRCLGAGLLIAADGRHSPTRALARIDAQVGQYQQTAIVANVETEYSHRYTAWQRFLSTGPLAFLPLANGQSSIVWSCDNEFAAQLTSVADDEFCEALGEAFEFKLGRISSCSDRLSFPLAWHHCEHWVKDRIMLIGDAAHSVHPLAGQGVNLGFSDVEILAHLVGDRSGFIPQKQLRRYERQRKSETWLAGNSFSALKWIYGLDQKWITQIRNLGMRVVDETPWFKRALLQKAINNLS
jgi:2-octaprenylphenol hydroxylase